jgi:hypothetical protein
LYLGISTPCLPNGYREWIPSGNSSTWNWGGSHLPRKSPSGVPIPGFVASCCQTRPNCILWCFSLFFPLGLKEFCLVYRNYFGFSHRVFQRFSSHFFWKVFRGVIYYIASPDFSYRVFKELFDWLQDHKKIKLITRPQDEENWSRGSVTKK